jgi:hypothetical protein
VTQLQIPAQHTKTRKRHVLSMPSHQVLVTTANIAARTGKNLIERDKLASKPALGDEMIKMVCRRRAPTMGADRVRLLRQGVVTVKAADIPPLLLIL